MKLLSTPKELQKEFKRLISHYDQIYWATAWASPVDGIFEVLKNNRHKIQKIVVGIHFYQTHPNFIEEFLDDEKVRFIQQPAGTFHPKLYLFSNSVNDEWVLIVGSANFTNQAFSSNAEASLLVSQDDLNAAEVHVRAMDLLDKTFSEGTTFHSEDLENYRTIWEIQKEKIMSLSGHYGNEKRISVPIHQVPIMTRTWDEFVHGVRNEKIHGLEPRLRVMEIAKKLFARVDHFNELADDERKFIAGIPNKLGIEGAEYWPFFGSMKGAGKFKNKIGINDPLISKALDQIPVSGQITKTHYDNFVKYYTLTFNGNYIATGTRLLCMKRPDTFICFDSKNKASLCRDFGIVQSNMSFDRYWNDIVLRIYDSEWWKNPEPINETEKKISAARAAFLDSLYYEE